MTPISQTGREAVAEVLERAAEKLSEPGVWGNCHCASTAIWLYQGGALFEDATSAENVFARFIGGHNRYDIYRWNDAPERTQAEVVAKLKEAAALAREQSK